MAQTVTLPSPLPAGLVESANAAGISLYGQNGGWVSDDPAAVQSFVSSYNPLLYVQQQALAAVVATLAARLAAGFTYSGVLIACDAEAQSAIGHVVEMANAILDNRTTNAWVSRTWPAMQIGATGVPLSTPQDMIDLGDAVGTYVADNKFHALDLEAQIKAPTATASSIAALDLDNSQGTWPTA